MNIRQLRGLVETANRRAQNAVEMAVRADRELEEVNVVLRDAVENYNAMVKEMMREAGLLQENITENERVRGQIQGIYMAAQCDGNAPKIKHPEEAQDG